MSTTETAVNTEVVTKSEPQTEFAETCANSTVIPPREPDDFRPTEHFLRRFSANHGPVHETRDRPPITGHVVETCIREGDVRISRQRFLYETHVEGHDWRLVAGLESSGPCVITAYVPGVHRGDDRGDRP